MGSLHGNDKRHFVLALTLGDQALADDLVKKGRNRDARSAAAHSRHICVQGGGSAPAREPLSGKILLHRQIVPGETGYAILRLGTSSADAKDEAIQKFDRDLDEVIATCESSRAYTAVIQNPKDCIPARTVLSRLNRLREHGIEFALHNGAEDFRETLASIIQTSVVPFDPDTFFKVSQRLGLYPRDVYILELRQRDFQNYKELLPKLKYELEFLGENLRNKQALIMLPDDSIPANPVRETRKTLERFGVDCFFYFTGEVHLGIRHDSRPGNNFTNYVTALNETMRAVGRAKILAPEEGWRAINPPEYETGGNFFYVRGFSTEDIPEQDDYLRDFKALKTSAGARLCFSIGGKRLPTQVYTDMDQHLNVPFSERSGEFIVQHNDADQLAHLRQHVHLRFARTAEEVRTYFEHAFRLSAPRGGFKYMTKPIRFTSDSAILYSEIARPSVVDGSFPGPSKSLVKEIRRVMSYEVDGLILNLESFKMDSSLYRNLAGQMHPYAGRKLALVVNDFDTYKTLRGFANGNLPVYRNVDEAWLATRFNVVPPQEGWKLFQPRVADTDPPLIVLEVSKVGMGHAFMTREIPGAFYEELERLRQSGLRVILDISRHEEVGKEAMKAILYMQTRIGQKSKFAVASPVLYGVKGHGIKEVYSSYAMARLSFLDLEKSPLGL